MKTKLLTLLVLQLGLAAVLAQPVITNQPQSQTNFAGATARFTVGATGAPPLSYQWRAYRSTSFTNIPWGSDALLSLTNVQPNFFRFAVVVTDAGGLSATSSPLVTLTVVTPPSITPANPTASLFADVTLFVTNGPVVPLSYQWLFNGEPIAGAVTNKLLLTNVQKTNAGNYAIVATYAIGAVTSQVAMLRITPFNSIYCFGFSWTDTGGKDGCPWPAPRYYQNRACNGPMWPEFLSTNLGMAYVGANNYAFCGAFSSDEFSQVAVNLRVPRKPELSLYCLWETYDASFGNVDLTNVVAVNQSIQAELRNNSNTVQRLYELGARAILWENQRCADARDLLLLGSYRAGLEDGYLRHINADLVTAMDAFSQTHPDVRIYFADFHALWDEIYASPESFGFTEIIRDALGDTNLLDKSFTGPGADYLYWDNSHPTTKFHTLLASLHLEALANAVLEKLEAKLANGSATIGMNHLLIGRDYTLQTSSDLTSWNDVQTFTASAGTNQVLQALETGTRSVFYRLQWQQ